MFGHFTLLCMKGLKNLSLMIKKLQATHVKHVKEFYETLYIKREQKLVEMK